MDIATQGIIGAALAQAFAPAKHSRRAACVGLIAGLLPDADALIHSASDPLLQLEYHRHFSHALISIPIGAALVALLLHFFFRRHLSFKQLYIFSLYGYGSGGLLDACTSYGTHLLWPFSSEPVAWNIIAIVDPLFTLALAIPLLIGLRRRGPIRVGIVLAFTYLLFGWVQHQRAEVVAYDLAAAREHQPSQLIVKPTIGNQLLWRSIYIVGDSVYVDAVRVGNEPRIYLGQSTRLFDVDRDLAWAAPTSRAHRDAVRFSRFARGFLAPTLGAPYFLGDIRYAMLPTRIEPLWGIQLDPSNPQAPAIYQTQRSLTPALRDSFITMLLGRDF
ncbi:MAG: metal-dependent hydrolase [Candidatus Latescibacterota bacterium]